MLEADKNGPTEPTEVRKARRTIRNSAEEIERVLAALRAGLEPDLAAKTTRAIQVDKAEAEALVALWRRENHACHPLTRPMIEAALDAAGGLAPILATADRDARAEFYRNLGLELTYEEPDGNPRTAVRYQLSGGGGIVVVQDIGKGCRETSARRGGAS